MFRPMILIENIPEVVQMSGCAHTRTAQMADSHYIHTVCADCGMLLRSDPR
jgi:hypothetical protein